MSDRPQRQLGLPNISIERPPQNHVVPTILTHSFRPMDEKPAYAERQSQAAPAAAGTPSALYRRGLLSISRGSATSPSREIAISDGCSSSVQQQLFNTP